MIHCPGGSLSDMASVYRKLLSEQAVSDIFIPTFERLRKYEGAWHSEQVPLFPEEIFMVVRDAELFFREMRYGGIRDVQFLNQEEEALFQSLWDGQRRLMMSTGYIENGCTYVTDGPLRGKESCIRKIDRHKRLARLELPFGTLGREIYAGLEITRKS